MGRFLSPTPCGSHEFSICLWAGGKVTEILPKLFKCPIKQISTKSCWRKISHFYLWLSCLFPLCFQLPSVIASLLLPTAKSVNMKENASFELFSFFLITAAKRIKGRLIGSNSLGAADTRCTKNQQINVNRRHENGSRCWSAPTDYIVTWQEVG